MTPLPPPKTTLTSLCPQQLRCDPSLQTSPDPTAGPSHLLLPPPPLTMNSCLDSPQPMLSQLLRMPPPMPSPLQPLAWQPVFHLHLYWRSFCEYESPSTVLAMTRITMGASNPQLLPPPLSHYDFPPSSKPPHSSPPASSSSIFPDLTCVYVQNLTSAQYMRLKSLLSPESRAFLSVIHGGMYIYKRNAKRGKNKT